MSDDGQNIAGNIPMLPTEVSVPMSPPLRGPKHISVDVLLPGTTPKQSGHFSYFKLQSIL